MMSTQNNIPTSERATSKAGDHPAWRDNACVLPQRRSSASSEPTSCTSNHALKLAKDAETTIPFNMQFLP
jgi:hypothetical protein